MFLIEVLMSDNSFDLPYLYQICSYTFTDTYDRFNFKESNSLFLSSLLSSLNNPDLVYEKSRAPSTTTSSSSGTTGNKKINQKYLVINFMKIILL